MPTVIQFEGRQNSAQFWMQEEALSELRRKLHEAVTDGLPVNSTPVHLEERPPPPPKKSSWLFGRKGSKAPEVPPSVQEPVTSTVTSPITVRLDDVHFRSETEFGLYETLSARVVMAMVDVR